MKFIVVISHAISHNLNQICEPFEIFDNFHVINGFFLTILVISVWWIDIFTNNHLQMECDKCFEVGLFLDFLKKLFLSLMQLNTRTIWNDNMSYVILCI
jgi:hypothetical protein